MVYPATLEMDEADSGVSGGADSSKENTAESAAILKRQLQKHRGTLASAHSSRQAANGTNQLQIPGAALADNALARDNSSICKVAEEGPKSERTKCCFICLEMSTKFAVYLAGAIGFSMNLVGLLFYSVQDQFIYGLPSLVSALLYLTVLFAQYRQRASMFLPFLVINASLLFLWTCLFVYLAVLFIFLPVWCVQLLIEYFEWDEIGHVLGTPTGADKIRSKVRIFLAISMGITLVYLLVESWLWWIIYRGYKAAKDWHAEEWLQNLNKNIRSISIY